MTSTKRIKKISNKKIIFAYFPTPTCLAQILNQNIDNFENLPGNVTITGGL